MENQRVVCLKRILFYLAAHVRTTHTSQGIRREMQPNHQITDQRETQTTELQQRNQFFHFERNSSRF